MRHPKLAYYEKGILLVLIMGILLISCIVALFFLVLSYCALTPLDILLMSCLLAVMIPGIIIAIILLMLRPYRSFKKLCSEFIQGHIYQKLIDRSRLYFPLLHDVLERFDNLVSRERAIELSTRQAELLALQNQINPHFLYNTLDAIRGDALCLGVDNIADITEALSTYFHYTITNAGTLVFLTDELENVENYFMIQQYRFGDKLKMTIDIPDSPEMLLMQCPKLMLQPIVENSIIHGLETKKGVGTVNISILLTDRNVLINVSDDGVGIEENELDAINNRLRYISLIHQTEEGGSHHGLALINVCRRIKLLFGEQYGIQVYSIRNMGTDVRITLPYIKKRISHEI